MDIRIFCQFEEETAAGILMKGKALGLQDLGHDTSVLFHPFKYQKKKPKNSVQKENGIVKRYIYPKFIGKRFLLLFFIPFYFLTDFITILRFLLKADAIVFHKPLPFSLFYAAVCRFFFPRRIKTICIVDDWESVGGMAMVRHANSPLLKIIATICEETEPLLTDGILCISKIMLDRYSLAEKTRHKCLYLPNGAALPTTTSNQAESPREGKKKVHYVGTFKSKALISFITEIIHRVNEKSPDYEFTLVGGGDLFHELEACTQDIENVTLTNQIPHQEVLEHLQKADLCLLYLNHEFPETFIDASRSSTKMFEYLAYQKVVIASDYGEPRNLFTHNESALLVENKPESFAQAIIDMDWNEIRRIGNNGYQLFEKELSHQALMKKFSAWLETL